MQFLVRMVSMERVGVGHVMTTPKLTCARRVEAAIRPE